MGSIDTLEKKPHAVCIPFPAQGHISLMLKLAKILHFKGFHITFVNTEFNHQRLLKSRGPDSLSGLPSFQFKTIPDGLPPMEADATQPIPELAESLTNNCLVPFKDLLSKINTDPTNPSLTCIVSDLIMSFTVEAAEEFKIPDFLLWTSGAGALLALQSYPQLIDRGLLPLKDESYLTNGHLDTVIGFIPSFEGVRLKDIPDCMRTTDPHNFTLKFALGETKRAKRATGIIFNDFYHLEGEVLSELSNHFPPAYPIGPLHTLHKQIVDKHLDFLGSNLWKEDQGCLEWLDSKEPNSVVYVNFGSITVMTTQQLLEFSWGLAKSDQAFLWVIRPDLVSGETAIFPPEFSELTKGRSLIVNWCPQEVVLSHPAIGAFLTHNGWNSTLETIANGVPILCWPFFADQQLNCWFSCNKWGIGMEVDNNVKRDEVERLVGELMVGEKGKEMKKIAMDWKTKAEEACLCSSGSSYISLEKLIHQMLQNLKILIVLHSYVHPLSQNDFLTFFFSLFTRIF